MTQSENNFYDPVKPEGVTGLCNICDNIINARCIECNIRYFYGDSWLISSCID